ncbi:hypothetical protein HMPREF9530_01008 [Escherichia coli MS 21-1]|nr:hypothetical protein HMPREF9530_01008 [Escherichia coli MS 21-1]
MRNHEEQQHETCCNAGAGIAEISPVPDAGDTPVIFLLTPLVCQLFVIIS